MAMQVDIVPNEKLITARLRKRWSTATASEHVGVSVNTFNRWERGLQIPQMETLDLLCKAFEQSPEELGFTQVITHRRTNRNEQPPMLNQTASPSLSRRGAISLMVTSSALLLLTSQSSDRSPVPQEEIEMGEIQIPLLWKLYFEGGMPELEGLLPPYLQKMDDLVKTTTVQREKAADQASRVYQLASLLSTQQQNFGKARDYADQALVYAQTTVNPHLEIASRVRQAQAWLYSGNKLQRLHTYQAALPLLSKASPLLRARVYIGLAEVQSALGDERAAMGFLEQALTTYPPYPTEDPCFSYTHFKPSPNNLHTLIWLQLGKPEKALSILDQLPLPAQNSYTPDQIDAQCKRALASLLLEDIDNCCSALEYTLRAASALNNPLRYDEACAVYNAMPPVWHSIPRVKQLAEQINLWRGH